MGDAENCMETAPPARKVIGRPYVKGQPSSNHSGRPKQLPEMRFKFRSYSDEALSALVKALKQPRYRVQAAATILASPHDCGATPAAAPREVPRMRPAPPPDLQTC